jgi:hypothetical protein
MYARSVLITRRADIPSHSARINQGGRQNTDYVLTCGHVFITNISPDARDSLYCRTCMTYRLPAVSSE